MTKNGIVLLISFAALLAAAAAGKLSEENDERVKRSDDFSASHAELTNLAQTVSNQEAEITALKNQLTKLQSSLRKSVGLLTVRIISEGKQAIFVDPRGLTFTWWGCCGLCQKHKPTELAHSFLFCSCVYFCLYGSFNCI